MDDLVVVELASQAMRTAFLLGAPALLVGLVIGLIVSLFQAVTSIQDPTLSFIPKILVIMVVILATFPWMVSLMRDFTVGLFSNINYYIR